MCTSQRENSPKKHQIADAAREMKTLRALSLSSRNKQGLSGLSLGFAALAFTLGFALQCSFGFLFCIEHDPTKKA
jgi:hypothetical protein